MQAVHPLLRCAAELHESMKSVAVVDPVFMTTDDQREALLELARVEARLAALRLRLAASAGEVAEVDGHRDVAAWLAHHTRVDGGEARRHLRLAHRLGQRPVLAAGLFEGAVNLAQADVIARALDDLPIDLDPDLAARAERHLADQAGEFGPRELRILGRRVLDVVAPEGGEQTSYDVRLGHAFCLFLEHADPRRLPVHGGDATTVVVTLDLATLRDGLGSAVTDNRTPISAGEGRRLACTARIIPAVLGADGQVLDLGRSARLFDPSQRKALRLRDATCRASGCDIPAAWCEAHHANDPWAHRGRTDLADGQLLCSFHHHRAHDPGLRTQSPAQRRRQVPPTQIGTPDRAGRPRSARRGTR